MPRAAVAGSWRMATAPLFKEAYITITTAVLFLAAAVHGENTLRASTAHDSTAVCASLKPCVTCHPKPNSYSSNKRNVKNMPWIIIIIVNTTSPEHARLPTFQLSS